MSLPAIVAAKTRRGYQAITVWNDGGAGSLGENLLREFWDQQKAEFLTQAGDLECLRGNNVVLFAADSFQDTVHFYTLNDLYEHMPWVKTRYLFRDGAWFFQDAEQKEIRLCKFISRQRAR